MNPFVVAKSAKNALSILEINFNRIMARELVPVQSRELCIETSSLCNLKCVFCPYHKKNSPKVLMTNAFFEDCVRQALDFGFRQFELTPCTGDAFMDRRFLQKLRFLEESEEVEGYRFFTNFTIPKPAQIVQLVRLNKLRQLTISIYGHDPASFVAITKSTENVYRRLVGNLKVLLSSLHQANCTLAFGIRSTRDMPKSPDSELMKLIGRFKERGVEVRHSHVYNNWGGSVTQSDVAGLRIDVTGTDATYKHGACSLLFTSYQIMATGIVNGCACRDVDATLRIGDMNTTPLRDILSPDNAAYMRLIEEQQQGMYRPVCRSCDFYKSIYHRRTKDRAARVATQTIEQYKDYLRTAGAAAAQAASLHHPACLVPESDKPHLEDAREPALR